MKKLLSLLVAAVMVLSFSFATLAEDSSAEKSAAADGKKKHDKKKAEGEGTKRRSWQGARK